MEYGFSSFLAVLLFMGVHLFAHRAEEWGDRKHARLLSFGGGVAIAYVFIDLLSKLGISQSEVSKALEGFFPFFERHVYVLALLGFLVFFVVEKNERSKKGYWLSLGSYAIFNFLVGYAVADKDDPEVQPLVLFTLAMALHFFTNDFSLSRTYEGIYHRSGRWILAAALVLGWVLGLAIELPATAVALVSAFIGGGVIMNVMRHELPRDNPNNLPLFLTAALSYAAILLFVGQVSKSQDKAYDRALVRTEGSLVAAEERQ